MHREITKFKVPKYWRSLSKVPDMGTSKNLSRYTDVGTVLSTHSSMFTEQVLVLVPTSVILLTKSSTEYPRFVAFSVATIHSPFSFAHTTSYKQPEKI